MASTYTPLGVEKMATGENAGTWGTKTNTNLEIIEQFAGGYTTQAVSDSGDTDLSVTDGGTGATLAHRVIELTGALTGARNVTIPIDVQQLYAIKNSTTGSQAVTFKYVTGTGSSVTFTGGDTSTKLIYGVGSGSNPNMVDLGMVNLTGTQTLTNKTLTSAVLNGTISGTSIKDEDNMASDSASHLATQQSIKAYVDTQLTAEDLDVQTDSGNFDVDLDSEALTIAGGTGIDTSGTGTTATVAIDSTVTTLTGTQTLTNKSLTAPVLTGSSASAGSIVFKEDTDNGTNAATLKGPAATADVTLTLPASDGTVSTESFATAIAVALG